MVIHFFRIPAFVQNGTTESHWLHLYQSGPLGGKVDVVTEVSTLEAFPQGCGGFKHAKFPKSCLPGCAESESPRRFQKESLGRGLGRSWERNGDSQSLICQYHCPYHLGMEGQQTCHLEGREKNTKIKKLIHSPNLKQNMVYWPRTVLGMYC